jgi:hypothetical protein
MLSRFAVSLLMESDKEVAEFIRGYMLGRMSKVTPAMFAQAIRDDTALWGNLPQGYKNFLKNIAKNRIAREAFLRYERKINTNLIIQWFKIDRPDLASIILNWPDQGAIRWLEKNINEIKQQFKNSF